MYTCDCSIACAGPLRFATDEQGLLLASDVAARGLDIHKVQHVIHYHVPVNSDVRGREGGGGGGACVVARSDRYVGGVREGNGTIPSWLAPRPECRPPHYRVSKCSVTTPLYNIVCRHGHLHTKQFCGDAGDKGLHV